MQAANALELVVFEPMSGIAYLPSGAALGGKPYVPPPPGAPLPPNDRTVRKALVDGISDYMRSNGYEWEMVRGEGASAATYGRFAHRSAIGELCVLPVVVSSGRRVTLLFEVSLRAIDDVVERLLGQRFTGATMSSSLSTLLPRLCPDLAGELLCVPYTADACSIETLPGGMKRMVALMREALVHALPAMASAQSVERVWQAALARLEGGKPLFDPHFYAAAVAGQMMGDSRFARPVEEGLKSPLVDRTVLEKFVADVKERVVPLRK